MKKTAFNYIHDYYCVSYCVCRGMHRRRYECHKSVASSVNRYNNFKNKCNNDAELSTKSESDDSAHCNST